MWTCRLVGAYLSSDRDAVECHEAQTGADTGTYGKTEAAATGRSVVRNESRESEVHARYPVELFKWENCVDCRRIG